MIAPHHPLLASFLLAACSMAAAPTTQPPCRITPDHADAMYHVGDKATFHIAAAPSAAASSQLTYRVTLDNFGPALASGPVASLPADIPASLNDPGVLRFELLDATTTVAVAAAAFDPTELKPSMPPPDDFDAFWTEQKKLVTSDPAKPVLTPVDSPAADVETFDLQVNCPGGAPLSGYYAKPKDAKPHSLPAILFPHSAGVRSSQLTSAVHGAKLGCISLDFNAHGLPNGKPASYYSDLYAGDLKGYTIRGRDSRDTTYFRGMFLRLIRALEFLTTQPEWDGKTLIVYGSSQGGGQALVAAGLDPRVTLCCASVPALCDHTGFAAKRISGWPKLVAKDASGKYDPKSTEAARYVDAMNFAPHIRAQTLVTVGLVDTTVPPTSVYAAFNTIKADKKILPQPTMGHDFPRPLQQVFDDTVRKHIGAQRNK